MKTFIFPFVFYVLLFLVFLGIATDTLHAQELKKPHQAVCGRQKDTFRCHAHVITDKKGKPEVNVSPYGLGPMQFRSAYSLSGAVAENKTIAIIDAYDDPRIYSDLNAYSTYFGIPSLNACPISQGTVAHPCFQKVNQNGGTNYPKANGSWALEIALDTQVAHSVCQNCNLLLVEANSASYTDLMTALDRAVKMGAKIISNSYGSNEFSSESQFDTHFSKPGIAFIFSSGDSGYGTEYPAASSYVTAVGGTTLIMNGTSYGSESVWDGTGSGCSLYESKPSWQTDSGCPHRTIADVSADADPNTGAAVYDTTSYFGYKGWFTVGGTSLAAPLIAGTYALGNTAPLVMANSLPYMNSSHLHDITSGTNGSCNIAYLCTGVFGYDGPSGLGSPNGSTAF